MDISWDYLVYHQSIKELRINKCQDITDEGIELLLGGLQALEILIFTACPKVNLLFVKDRIKGGGGVNVTFWMLKKLRRQIRRIFEEI